MASITSWVRIEPRARDAELLAGVDARVHDPLWLLARQWQLGELDGVDAGSAIFARTRAEVARVDAWRTGEGPWHALDPDTTPLAAALAPARDERTPRPRLVRRARGGQQLLRLLGAAHVATSGPVFVSRYPLTVNDVERAALDVADAQFLVVLARRVPDGDAAAAALRPLLQAGDLPGDFGIPGSDLHAVSGVCRAWLAWFDALEHAADASAWQPEQLAYSFEARAGAAGGDLRLVAKRHTNGSIAWHDVDAVGGEASRRESTRIVSTSLPTHVRYRGMPARRYWELEDAAVRWASIDAGPGDVARLLFVEFGLTLADHWLSVPVAVPAGSVTRVASLVVTDTFGVRSLIRAAADLDGAEGPWRFLELSRTGDVPGPQLFIPPAAVSVSARALDTVEFARDDVSDVLWAIDRVILGGDGRPRDVVPAPPRSPGADLTYRVGPDVDPAYHPYRARDDVDGLALALAAIPGHTQEIRPDLPARMRTHALPGRPLRLVTCADLTRASDGSYHLVERRDRAVAVPPPFASFAFDVLEGAT